MINGVNILNNYFNFLPIWITVSLSAQYIPLKSNLFDLLVVDEASQCDIPSAIPLFFRAKRVVIIGDPWQLKHISTIQKEKEIKIAGKCDVMQLLPDYSYREKSLYGLGERVLSYSNQKPIRLEKHYRSHHKIISFSDAQFYNYLSFCTDESKLKSINEYGVKWIDVHGKAEKDDNDKWVNKKEAEEVVKFLCLVPQRFLSLCRKEDLLFHRFQLSLDIHRKACFLMSFFVDCLVY